MRTTFLLASATLLVGTAIIILLPTDPRLSDESPVVEEATPKAATIDFVRFDESTGEPYAKLTFRNTTDRPIFFAGYGPTYPLQTWERRDKDRWIECGYDWCGTGRSIERLGVGQELEISVRLRNYRTPAMRSDPSLADYRDQMRVVLYYGLTGNDIHYPIQSQPFSGMPRNADEQDDAREWPVESDCNG